MSLVDFKEMIFGLVLFHIITAYFATRFKYLDMLKIKVYNFLLETEILFKSRLKLQTEFYLEERTIWKEFK